jgi:hypothetical protein
MSEKITIVTSPDDIYTEGLRIFLYDLNEDQYSIFSQSVLGNDKVPSMIIYNADILTDIKWTLDKLLKSSLIFFNAESDNQQMIGYLCSKMNSYYFGKLRDLSIVNNSIIFDVVQLKEIIERRFEKYGKI